MLGENLVITLIHDGFVGIMKNKELKTLVFELLIFSFYLCTHKTVDNENSRYRIRGTPGGIGSDGGCDGSGFPTLV